MTTSLPRHNQPSVCIKKRFYWTRNQRYRVWGICITPPSVTNLEEAQPFRCCSCKTTPQLRLRLTCCYRAPNAYTFEASRTVRNTKNAHVQSKVAAIFHSGEVECEEIKAPPDNKRARISQKREAELARRVRPLPRGGPPPPRQEVMKVWSNFVQFAIHADMCAVVQSACGAFGGCDAKKCFRLGGNRFGCNGLGENRM